MACVPESASAKQPSGLFLYLLSMLLLLSCQQTEKGAAAGGESGNKWDGLKEVYCPSPGNCNTWHTRWHYCNFNFFKFFLNLLVLFPHLLWHYTHTTFAKVSMGTYWTAVVYHCHSSSLLHLTLLTEIFLGEDLLLQSITQVTDISFDNENKKPYYA